MLWQPPPHASQVWLPAMKAALEILHLQFRQAGSISMDLQLTNKALQVMTDFNPVQPQQVSPPRPACRWPAWGLRAPAPLAGGGSSSQLQLWPALSDAVIFLTVTSLGQSSLRSVVGSWEGKALPLV